MLNKNSSQHHISSLNIKHEQQFLRFPIKISTILTAELSWNLVIFKHECGIIFAILIFKSIFWLGWINHFFCYMQVTYRYCCLYNIQRTKLNWFVSDLFVSFWPKITENVELCQGFDKVGNIYMLRACRERDEVSNPIKRYLWKLILQK